MQGFKKGTTGSYAILKFLQRTNDDIWEYYTVMIVLYKLLKYIMILHYILLLLGLFI